MPRKPSSNPTIADVARECDVGSMTVSRVVNGGKLVSPRTAAKVRAALQATPDAAWKENWKLSFQGKTIFEGQRFLAYREMFLNHLVHHRAQLGVYLRLDEKPVPATYGPSADDKMGF